MARSLPSRLTFRTFHAVRLQLQPLEDRCTPAKFADVNSASPETPPMHTPSDLSEPLQLPESASNVASVGVPGPVNDRFEQRIPLVGPLPLTQQGSNANATKALGEPNHGGNVGPSSVWYSWTAPIDGPVQIDTIGSEFDTLLGVYTGDAVASLTSVAQDDQSGGGNTSKVAFSAAAGTTYQIAVDGWEGNTGSFTLNLNPLTLLSNRSLTDQIVSGGIATLQGTIHQADPNETFTLTIDWGDGSPVETRVYPPGSHGTIATVTHTYTSELNDYFPVSVEWRDSSGRGDSDFYWVSVFDPIITAVEGVVSVRTTYGTEQASFRPFGDTYTGEVHVTQGDFSGDGVPEIVVAAGYGGGPRVRVLNRATGEASLDFFAYDMSFSGGVQIAVGDFNGDGVPDIVTGAGAGGGPHIKMFDGVTGAEFRSFFAYGRGFSGGVSIDVADFNGDGVPDIVTGAGAGGGPHVKVFDGSTGAETSSFFAYDEGFSGGVNVAAGDSNYYEFPYIVTGAGPGGGPHVKVFGASGTEVANFYAFDEGFSGGVRVSTQDFDRDGLDDILAGAGPGGGPQVKWWNWLYDYEMFSFFAGDQEFTGGVNVSS